MSDPKLTVLIERIEGQINANRVLLADAWRRNNEKTIWEANAWIAELTRMKEKLVAAKTP